MRWSEWKRHFEASAGRPFPETDASGDGLPAALGAAVAYSLARFQAGEAGEGRIARRIWGVSLDGIDDDYRLALGLFVREEGRHARILAGLVTSLGGELLRSTWTERLFVGGRRLMGLRLKLLVLLAAEVIGIGFYGLLAERLPPGRARACLEELCGDEAFHLRFHGDFFRTQTAVAWRRLLFGAAWWAVGAAAALVVLLDHRRTLAELGVRPAQAVRRLVSLLRLAYSSSVLRSPSRRRSSRADCRETVTACPRAVRAR